MQAARSQQGAAARTGLDEERQPTLLLLVPQDAMLAILDETPRGWHALAMLLTCRTRHAFDEIEASALLPAGGRVARKLLALAGGYGNHALMHRMVRVPQQQLAAMLALSRQTVNRSLEQLEAQGTIRLTRSGTELVDLDRLREIAQ